VGFGIGDLDIAALIVVKSGNGAFLEGPVRPTQISIVENEVGVNQLHVEGRFHILAGYQHGKKGGDEREKEKERKEAQKIEIIERLNNLDHENFKGTGLALLNSVTHFQSHVQPVKKTKENWEVKRFFTNAQTSLYSLGQMIQQAA
jgi:hypothetical protein